MHYKNGREAKPGDPVVWVMTPSTLNPQRAGILYAVNAGTNTCNARICVPSPNDQYVPIKECLHAEDVASATIPDDSKPAEDTGPREAVKRTEN